LRGAKKLLNESWALAHPQAPASAVVETAAGAATGAGQG
jgi:hypothetical protein